MRLREPVGQLQQTLEREYLLDLYAQEGGDTRNMAAKLGISRQALYSRFKKLRISVADLSSGPSP